MERLLSVRIENFKKISLATFHPGPGVTRIIGKNAAGKTSSLDGISCALGGAKLCPKMPIREGEREAEIYLELEKYNVLRKFWLKDDGELASSVEVTGKKGQSYKSPQTAILNPLLGDLTFDPLAFQSMKPRDQAALFAKMVGIDLDAHEAEYNGLFSRRAALTKQAKDASTRAIGLPVHRDAPNEPQSASALMVKLKERQALNAERARLDGEVSGVKKKIAEADTAIGQAKAQVERIRKQLADAENAVKQWENHRSALDTALLEVLEDFNATAIADTAEIEKQIAATDSINAKVRDNQRRKEAIAAAELVQKQADELSTQLEEMKATFSAQIAAAKLPVEGLTFDPTGVKLNGIPFEQCSGAQRLRTSVLVGLSAGSELKLMLIKEDGSKLDEDGMKVLETMAEEFDCQILIERVYNGTENGVFIVEGETVDSIPAFSSN
jgi:DNA repair ATPase RecN